MDDGLLALALVAGAVAAFNPCGFALLPPYLALLVAGDSDDRRPDGSVVVPAVARALRFTAGMTVGFVAVFTTFGVVVAPLALSVERYLPYVTVVIGVLLVLLGGWLLSGRELAVRRRGRGSAPNRSWWSQAGYGVSFALASLSCTIGPFLAVTSTSLRATSFLGVVAAYLAYALGMAAVVLVLALAAATAQASVVRRMRRAQALVGRVGGLVLLVAGAYVAWYGRFEIRVLAGGRTSDPVVGAAIQVQGFLTQVVTDAGATSILVLLGVLVVLVSTTLGLRVARRRGVRTGHRPSHDRV